MTTKNVNETPRGRPFEPGNPGGPGRPEGSRNKASVLLDKLASDKAQAILEKVLAAAENGDSRSAELILSRIWPARRTRPVSLELPEIKTAADTQAAVGAIVTAAASGAIDLQEAEILAGLVDTHRRALETSALEDRIRKLEQATARK